MALARVLDQFTFDQNCLERGRTFKRDSDSLLLNCNGHTPTTEQMVTAFQTVYPKGRADGETELMEAEGVSDDIDAALTSAGSTPDQYEKLRRLLETEGVIGAIVRREGALELVQSLARVMDPT